MKKLKSVKEAVQELENPVDTNKQTLLPSGCDLFSLACSGSVGGWIYQGLIANIIGDSNSGKTIIALTILASIYREFKDAFEYEFHDYEMSLKTINIAKLFGASFAKALKIYVTKPGPDATIEKFYVKAKKNFSASDKPRAVVCDSWDALSCKAELRNLAKEEQKIGKEDDKSGGGYNMERAKASSRYIGKLMQYVASSDSLLIILSQTRDKTPTGGFMSKFADNRTRSGGKALKFYSCLEIWLSIAETLGKDRKRPIGTMTKCVIKRSKLTGKFRTCKFPILNAYGVDNTRATIHFLCDEGVFKVEGKQNPKYTINGVSEEKFTGSMIECAEWIETSPIRIKKLRKLLIRTWNELEEKAEREACGNRKRKFED